MAKYPCADGINRDRHIERHLELEARRAMLLDQRRELDSELGKIARELSEIQYDHLGGIGNMALEKARNAQRP